MSLTLGDLPVGAKVKAEGSLWYEKDLIFRKLGEGHSQDPADSVILQTNDIITVRCFDAAEPNNYSDSNREKYGNNRYLYSNLLQWLNSDAAAGEWYTAKYYADQAPDSANVQNGANQYSTQIGFMNSFTADFKNSLLTVTKRTVKNTVTDGGGYEDVQSKFFLLSMTEVGLENENNIAEGSKYSFFSDSTKRIMVPTTECANNSTNKSITAGSPHGWWLRTPYADSSYHVRSVYTSGQYAYMTAFTGIGGVAPACAISKDQKVSDTVDSDGCYTLIYKQKIDKPIMSTTSYDVTGSSIAPILEGYDASTMTLSGNTSETAVGNYTLSIVPKSGYKWDDDTETAISFNWSIIPSYISQININGAPYNIQDSSAQSKINSIIEDLNNAQLYRIPVNPSDTSGMNIWIVDLPTLGDLPVGTKVKVVGSQFYGEDLVFRILGPGHSQDPADSIILQTNDIISVRCFDAKEPNNSDSDRQNYGNNRYLYSNLLQWLNSDAGAGEWYTARHTADQKPDSANIWQNSGMGVNPYDTQAGFMNGFTTDFKNSLLTVIKRTAKDTVIDGGGYEDVESKFFLLSTTEVGLANENNIVEGELYPLFNDSTKRIMVLTTECANNSVGYSMITAGRAWYWWLRTPRSGYSNSVRIVSTNGTIYDSGAYTGGYGVAPACAISKNQLVSSEPDSDGCYTLVF